MPDPLIATNVLPDSPLRRKQDSSEEHLDEGLAAVSSAVSDEDPCVRLDAIYLLT